MAREQNPDQAEALLMPDGSFPQEAVYLVNQRIILLVKMTVLLGVPLLCSFLLPSLAVWQLPSVLLVLAAFYLNNLYPDRIALSRGGVRLKIFLYPQWLTFSLGEVQYAQGSHCLYLYVGGKRRYRISMEHLSMRLYRQITELLEPYQETL